MGGDASTAMMQSTMRRLVLLFILLQAVSLLAAEKPTWSIFATTVAPCSSSELNHCRSVQSFYGGKTVSLRLVPNGSDFDGKLSVRTQRSRVFPLSIDNDWNLLGGVDVLWSPDSRFLAITGGLNAYTESTRIFEVTPSGVRLLNVFHEAKADMLKGFPPCKSAGIDREDCERREKNPFFNFAAIAWSDPNTLVVMAEIPCSSSRGIFMCQVMGYEIDVRTGHVFRRMDARQFKARWQQAMAWNFRIPESPESLMGTKQR
jgi:hypothetical protein